MNFFEGVIDIKNNTFKFGNTSIKLDSYDYIDRSFENTNVILGVRPEDISINSDLPSLIQTTVELIEPMGADTLIWSSIESKPFSIRIEGSAELQLNDSLNINFDVARSSIFDKQTEERL